MNDYRDDVFYSDIYDDIPSFDEDGLTNFDASERPIYEEAIRRYGDDSLYIGVAMPPMGSHVPLAGDLALRRDRSIKTGDLSPFWRIFEQVRAEHRKEPA